MGEQSKLGMIELDVVPAEAKAVAQQIVTLLPSLMRTFVAALHTAPAPDGMHLAQFRVLSRLRERDYRAGELAEALEVGRPTLSATADCLVRRGLIERRREPAGDRRGVRLRLTPAGEALCRALESRAAARVAGLVAGMHPAERSALACGLLGLARAFDAARDGSDEPAEVGT